MDETVYSLTAWRELPRTRCLIETLFGDVAGPCSGRIHRHHVDPDEPYGRTIEVCAAHHPRVEAILRRLRQDPPGCPHRPGTHRYAHAREECARRHRERFFAAA
jgi:hypothetical protein